MEPIIEFKNNEEATKCLKEWQSILGLNNWCIEVRLANPCEMELQECDGECDYQPTNSSAVIKILKSQYYGNRVLKYCAERILVHELLHCKFSLIERMLEFYGVLHQTHEEIARALICAKYEIPLEWFHNI